MFGDKHISQEAYNSLYNVLINIISAINGLRDEIKALNSKIMKLEKLLKNKEGDLKMIACCICKNKTNQTNEVSVDGCKFLLCDKCFKNYNIAHSLFNTLKCLSEDKNE